MVITMNMQDQYVGYEDLTFGDLEQMRAVTVTVIEGRDANNRSYSLIPYYCTAGKSMVAVGRTDAEAAMQLKADIAKYGFSQVDMDVSLATRIAREHGHNTVRQGTHTMQVTIPWKVNRSLGQMTFEPELVGKATSLDALSRKSYAPHSMANEPMEFLSDMPGEYVVRIYRENHKYRAPYAGRGGAIGFIDGDNIIEVQRKARELVRTPNFKSFIVLPKEVKFQTYQFVQVYPFVK